MTVIKIKDLDTNLSSFEQLGDEELKSVLGGMLPREPEPEKERRCYTTFPSGITLSKPASQGCP